MPEQWSDEELEGAFRDGLRRAASEAPTRLRDGIPHVADSPRGPSRRRVVWLAAAAAAVVAVGVPVALGGGGRVAAPPASGTSAGSVTSSATSTAGPGSDWRTESYGGVELDVPSTWGWGGTPVNPGIGGSVVCDVRGATVAPDGTRDSNATMDLPFVGRPVLQSDACSAVAPADARPAVDAVWFASPLAPGSARGVRTVAVGGQRVSVFTANAATRDRILASVRVVGAVDGHGCPTALRSAESAVRVAEPDELVVCAYTDIDGRPTLLFSAARGRAAALAYDRAMAAAPHTSPKPCGLEPRAETVRIGLVGGGRTSWDTISLGSCTRILPSEGREVMLTPSLVSPWSGPESTVYLVGPTPGTDTDWGTAFRGILG